MEWTPPVMGKLRCKFIPIEGESMDIQSRNDLQESFNKLKEWIAGIEDADLVDAEKIYATALFLVGAMVNVNSDRSTFTFENVNNKQTGQVYGDYELVIRKLPTSKEDGICEQCKTISKLGSFHYYADEPYCDDCYAGICEQIQLHVEPGGGE